jgi:hypothetical protein
MSFKTFDLSHDVANLVSSINEVVAISASLFSGIAGVRGLNVKTYDNIASGTTEKLGGYFQTVYDSAPASSLSTALLDATYGYTTASVHNVACTVSSSQNEKIKIYRQFANTLLGNADSKFSIDSTDRNSAFFICIKRNMQKDELKKGATSLIINRGGIEVTASDDGAASSFKQTIGGDYAPLKVVTDTLSTAAGWTGKEVGQVWYNAGVIVLPAEYCFQDETTCGSAVVITPTFWSGTKNLDALESSGTISQLVDGLFGAYAATSNAHVCRVDFHNQTNLYSSVYFCRATNSEFNYSSNPTFVDNNKRIRVTSGSNILQTRTYITTVGLYDASDNLLAAAKVNKPITKSPDTEATMRIRLDY